MVTETKYAMTHNTLHDEQDALAYMVECTLATVSHMAGLARPQKSELSRQISIAQTGIDWVKTYLKPGMSIGCGRVQEVIDSQITVEELVERQRAARP